MTADEIAARELILYAENDQPLYKRFLYWKENFDAKKKRGVYNRELAIKGLENNYVPEIIKKYKKEFGLGNIDAATKKIVAINFVDIYEQGD